MERSSISATAFRMAAGEGSDLQRSSLPGAPAGAAARKADSPNTCPAGGVEFWNHAETDCQKAVTIPESDMSRNPVINRAHVPEEIRVE
jgi:hypothetical protein